MIPGDIPLRLAKTKQRPDRGFECLGRTLVDEQLLAGHDVRVELALGQIIRCVFCCAPSLRIIRESAPTELPLGVVMDHGE
jgi:hypothetical protein